MRLLIDEMCPKAIAEQLRSRGHDTSAVTERPELRSLPDAELFEIALEERRTVVTENIADFSSTADDADKRGRAHHGLILVDPAKFPRGQKRTLGRLVTALHRLLKSHPSDDPTSLRHWL